MTTTYLWNPPPVHRCRCAAPPNACPSTACSSSAATTTRTRSRWAPGRQGVEVPFYFTKAPSTLVESGATVPYPPETRNYHHEMELVVAIGTPGFRVPEAEAASSSSTATPAGST